MDVLLDAVVLVMQLTAIAILVAGAFLVAFAAICVADDRSPRPKSRTGAKPGVRGWRKADPFDRLDRPA